MRELGPVKEPEDEKAPKKKSLKGGFLASWMRRENSGEPDNKLDEQDLVDPEQDALFNDGFSKRWHKLFSGTMPVDDTSTADNTAADQKTDEVELDDKKPVEPVAAVVEEDSANMADEAREQVLKAAKSAQELKGEVEVQHDAGNLTDKEITANVPAKSSKHAKDKTDEPSAEPVDFDVFTSGKPKPKQPTEPLGYEDIESTPEATSQELPELKDNADGVAINVSPIKTGDLFPRVDPVEYAHETDIEDNVEAPGAPTKGYRGLLVVDHPDRADRLAKTPPPSLPPMPEAFLPEIAAAPVDSTAKVVAMPLPAKGPSYVLPPKDAAKWPNPLHSYPVAGGSYTPNKINRNVQSLIDRPASTELNALVDKIAATNRQHEAAQVTQQDKQVPEKSAVVQSPEKSEGATAIGAILKDSPLKAKVQPTAEQATEEPLEKPTPELVLPIAESDTPISEEVILSEPAAKAPQPMPTPLPAFRPEPAPLYTPPSAKPLPAAPAFPTQPSLNLPVLAQPGRYHMAMKRGILGGLAISGAVMMAYLFG